MMLVDIKNFLFGRGALEISLQTEKFLNGSLNIVIHL